MTYSKKPIGAIILAGGLSSRMGTEKGLVRLNGKPMILAVIEAAKKISADIILVANKAEYNQFGYPVFKDDFQEKGPLGGIYTGLKNSAHDYNLVLSCDIPFISTEVLKRISDYDPAFDISVAGHQGKIHPLVGIYSKACLPVMEEHIRKDQLKVTGIFEKLKSQIIPFSDDDAGNFRNINSQADL